MNRRQQQKKARRECWLVFGLLQPTLMVLFAYLGGNNIDSLWSCGALVLAVTLGFTFPFLLMKEFHYQLGYGWD